MSTPGKVKLEILSYLHCRRCLQERPGWVSPAEYAELEVGWTMVGLQIWCRRHNVNVMHMDFQGQKHPAETRTEVPAEDVLVVGGGE